MTDTFGSQSVPWLLDQWAQRTPDGTFLVWEPFSGPRRAWSYAEFQSDVRAVASSLRDRGVQCGSFVLVHMENSPEFLLSWLACAEIGAVAVATNTRSVGRDLTYFAEHTGAVGALTQPGFAGMVRASCPDLSFLAVTDTDAGEPATADDQWGAVPFSTLIDGAPEVGSAIGPTSTSDLGVQFTSGTTSRPKAVLWTHANALWAGKVGASRLRLTPRDHTLVFLPLFHTNAQAVSLLPTLWSGGTVVLQPRFSASRFWDVSVRNEVTWVSTIPFALKALADQDTPDHSYRCWGIGARFPAVERAYGVRTMGWWGMTETLGLGIDTDYDHPGPPGTIGRPAPGYEVSIRDAEGNDVGANEPGHLFVRGTRGVQLFKEYYGHPEANAAAFDEDGWFDTGDLIRSDENGDLFFCDRDKDMLRVGAENVAASEVESVVMATGLAAECAVVAKPHPMLDEVPVAFVIARPDAPEDSVTRILDHCAANLADFKVPVEVHLVDDLPRATLEKVAKNVLRERWADAASRAAPLLRSQATSSKTST